MEHSIIFHGSFSHLGSLYSTTCLTTPTKPNSNLPDSPCLMPVRVAHTVKLHSNLQRQGLPISYFIAQIYPGKFFCSLTHVVNASDL
jgi:hypothetical protein